eukprot:6119187-Pyramimonas_sp.AAC.1
MPRRPLATLPSRPTNTIRVMPHFPQRCLIPPQPPQRTNASRQRSNRAVPAAWLIEECDQRQVALLGHQKLGFYDREELPKNCHGAITQ